MKTLLAMLALSALLPASAFALNENSTAILDFAAQAVPSNQSFAVHPFPYAGTTGFVVLSNGEAYAVFASGVPVLEGQPLTDAANIEGALAAYYSSQGYSPNLTFSDVHAGIESVSDNYQPGEAKCRVLTGTDRTKCIDFESCQRACYSVTSFCQPIALGTGRVFIDEIWKFENSSLGLDKAYLGEQVAHSALPDGITHEEALAYLDSLVTLNRAATQASNSQLYDAYSYCFEPDYALPVITNMQLYAQKAYAKSRPFFTLSQDAQLVRQRTLDALERKKASEPPPAANETDESALQNATVPGGSEEPASPPQSSSLSDNGSADLLPLAGAAGLALIFAAAIYAALSVRKKRK
jgi:hypothetical protein